MGMIETIRFLHHRGLGNIELLRDVGVSFIIRKKYCTTAVAHPVVRDHLETGVP